METPSVWPLDAMNLEHIYIYILCLVSCFDRHIPGSYGRIVVLFMTSSLAPWPSSASFSNYPFSLWYLFLPLCYTDLSPYKYALVYFNLNTKQIRGILWSLVLLGYCPTDKWASRGSLDSRPPPPLHPLQCSHPRGFHAVKPSGSLFDLQLFLSSLPSCYSSLLLEASSHVSWLCALLVVLLPTPVTT